MLAPERARARSIANASRLIQGVNVKYGHVSIPHGGITGLFDSFIQRGLGKIVFWVTFILVLLVFGGGALVIDTFLFPGFFGNSFGCICIGSLIVAAVISSVVTSFLQRASPNNVLNRLFNRGMGGGGLL